MARDSLVLKQLALSENPVASTPLKEKASFLLRTFILVHLASVTGTAIVILVRKSELDLYQIALASAL